MECKSKIADAVWAAFLEAKEPAQWLEVAWLLAIDGQSDAALHALRQRYDALTARRARTFGESFFHTWDRVYRGSPEFDERERCLLFALSQLGDEKAPARLLIGAAMIYTETPWHRECVQVINDHLSDAVLDLLAQGIDARLPEAALVTDTMLCDLKERAPENPHMTRLLSLHARFAITVRECLRWPERYLVTFSV